MSSLQDAVPFPYIKATQYQALKVRQKCLLDYHHPNFHVAAFLLAAQVAQCRKNLSSSAVESLAMNSFQAAYFKYVTN